MEVLGFCDDFKRQLLKTASVRLCPAVAGQVLHRLKWLDDWFLVVVICRL